MSYRKGILVVSFGTTYSDTRQKTIDRIEQELQDLFPEYKVYGAWTSSVIRKKIEQRDGIHIPDVLEALSQMESEGIQRVVVQPTHIIPGIENDKMKQMVNSMRSHFACVEIAEPLLVNETDCQNLIQVLGEEILLQQNQALIFMGHGTRSSANHIYSMLQQYLKKQDAKGIYIATVESQPDLPYVVKILQREYPVKEVLLTPLMFVSGDHAQKDLAGDQEDSWKNQLQRMGYEVTCILKGLGEYPKVRELIYNKSKSVMNNIEQ